MTKRIDLNAQSFYDFFFLLWFEMRFANDFELNNSNDLINLHIVVHNYRQKCRNYQKYLHQSDENKNRRTHANNQKKI